MSCPYSKKLLGEGDSMWLVVPFGRTKDLCREGLIRSGCVSGRESMVSSRYGSIVCGQGWAIIDMSTKFRVRYVYFRVSFV